MSEYYMLDDNNKVIKTNNLTEWAIWYQTHRHLLKQEHIGKVQVSTVFLGLDHGFGEGNAPILFETMIFGGEHDQYQDRCSTYEDAMKMHDKAKAMVAQ